MANIELIALGKNNKPYPGAVAGTWAIFDAGVGYADSSGLVDPLNNLSKVKLHSAFAYPKVLRVVSSRDPGNSPVTIAARAEGTAVGIQDVVLCGHGRPTTPLFFAEFETGGYRQPAAGTVIPLSGGSTTQPVNQRFCTITSDATNFYMHVRGWTGASAITVHWKIWICDEQFQADNTSGDLMNFTPYSATGAALGPIDIDHRYIRKVPSGGGELRIMGKPTISFDVQGVFPAVNYSDGATNAAMPGVFTTPYPTAHFAATGTEVEIYGGVTGDTEGWHLEHPMRLIAPDGRETFTVAKAMLSGLSRCRGTVATYTHAAAAVPNLYQSDHDLGPAPAGANVLFGWARVQEAGKFVANNRPFDFSGTVILDAAANKTSGYAQIIYAMAGISPVITGGRVVLREHGWSHSHPTPSIAGITIPACTIEYDLYAAAFVGGD